MQHRKILDVPATQAAAIEADHKVVHEALLDH